MGGCGQGTGYQCGHNGYARRQDPTNLQLDTPGHRCLRPEQCLSVDGSWAVPDPAPWSRMTDVVSKVISLDQVSLTYRQT
ncbi:hypothetical protein Vau01_095300 [Virgisporangium aurantiacum]|uniref:Uncharacterized protein n=1 Tax=Virgisporangium aurantiacum TaxID=175570 RepID=A0A8J3ZD44_9ACTN|nr:hypothetical protein Vau01_095300 [Virgisporangium aurantiacum]